MCKKKDAGISIQNRRGFSNIYERPRGRGGYPHPVGAWFNSHAAKDKRTLTFYPYLCTHTYTGMIGRSGGFK